MERLNITYEEGLAHSAFNDMLPKILDERVKTCIGNYRDKNGKSPNAVILSDEARNALFNAGLLNIPLSFSSLQSRDTLTGKEFQLGVYNIDELPKKKRSVIEKRLSETPGTIYMGRTNWRGLGNKIRSSSLEAYEFKCSF